MEFEQKAVDGSRDFISISKTYHGIDFLFHTIKIKNIIIKLQHSTGSADKWTYT